MVFWRSVQRNTGIIVAMIGIFFGAILFPADAFALSTSTGEILIETPIKADDNISVTASIGRDYGQTGALTIEVSPRGSCGGCVSSASYFVIPSTTQNYSFPLTVSAGNLTEGAYTQLVSFYLYTEAGDGNGSASATIQQGITIAVRFSIAAGVNASSSESSSSGGGGGRTGSSSSDTKASDSTVSESDTTSKDNGSDTSVVVEEDVSQETDESTEESVATKTEEETFISEGPAVLAETPIATTQIFSTPDVSDVTVADDASITMEEYFSELCTKQCDVNGDGVVSFADVVVQYAYFTPEVSDANAGDPPVIFGPPLATNDVTFAFEPGGIVGEYDFQLTSAYEEMGENIVTFYLLAHTGITGILASEIRAVFDPGMMQFVGMDTAGSIFPYTHISYKKAEQGILHVGGVTQSAFIGTNGYIAAFHFIPLTAGAVSVVFQDVAAYQPNIVTAATLNVKDIAGVFFVPNIEEEGVFQGTELDGVEVYPFQHRWIILVLLGMIVCMALAGAVYCFTVKIEKK